MHMTQPPSRNPRYLSIPTLLFALVFAHVVHLVCGPLGLNAVLCTGIYLLSLAAPIALKRAFTPSDANAGLSDFDDIHRLPTSRFRTMTGPNDHAKSGRSLTY